MPDVTVNLCRFIHAQLAADAELFDLVDDRFYEGQAPQEATYPFIRFAVLDTPHSTGNGARRMMTRPLVLIEAIGQTEALADLEPIATRIDHLFGERAKGVARTLQVLGSYCERSVNETETDEGGVVHKRLGGEYRFFVFPAG